MATVLLLAFVFLVAGVFSVPIASRLGLGSVLGYLIAGILISPLLKVFGVDVVSIQHFAEFGVVMMLFLIGLELRPSLLWEMRLKLVGLGGLQVTASTLIVMALAMLTGLTWNVSLAIGLIFSLSSTAIVLQTLAEKGLLKGDGGRSCFSILLFQDIAMIPMLAFMPLLAIPELAETFNHAAGAEKHGAEFSLVSDLNAWQHTIVTIIAVTAVIVGGTVLTRPVFRYIASAELRELFTATALMMIVGTAFLMTAVDLSPALGTFLAGVVLANSEYRHELESTVEPFKGLLLGLFFITVGAGINFGLLSQNFLEIASMTLVLIALKACVLYGAASLFKLKGPSRWLPALALAQAGEFGFVLLTYAVSNAILEQNLADKLLLVIALSMLLSPALFIIYDRYIVPRYALKQDREPDTIEEKGQIIIAGHGRFGGVVNRMLRGAGYPTTVIDNSAEQLDMLRKFGFEVYYGDPTRPELLHAAGIDDASLLIIAISGKSATTELTRYVIQNYPNLHVIARALDRDHVYDLYEAGCRDIIRETFDGAVRAGRSAYEALGVHPFDAERISEFFVKDDKAMLAEMAALYDPSIPNHENEAFVEKSKALAAERDEQQLWTGQHYRAQSDASWSPPTLADVETEEEAADKS